MSDNPTPSHPSSPNDPPLGRQAPNITGSTGGLTHHQVQFTGKGTEFFGIWIVNILLSLITLGIYSAWAKVRTKRYFNGNTVIDGHAFDYHANPVQILKGRIIVVVVLIVLNVLSQIHPLMIVPLLLFYLVALPWVIIRGLAFNAKMTSYRSLRFNFSGKKRTALLAYIVWPIAAMLSFGLLMPFASQCNARFLGNGHRFGTARFAANPNVNGYYRGLLYSYGVLLLIGILVAGLAFGVAGIGQSNLLANDPGSPQFLILAYVFVIGLYVLAGLAFTVYSAVARNHSYNNLILEGGHRFSSNIKILPWFWIIVSNLVLIICTFTLYTPWAMVRVARYKAQHTHVFANGDLDRFVAASVDDAGVVSGEFLDIEGFDFGF